MKQKINSMEKAVIVAKNPTSVHVWSITLRFAFKNDVKVHAIDTYLPEVENVKRLLKDAYGIEQVGETKKVKTINEKTGNTIYANEIVLEKPGPLKK